MGLQQLGAVDRITPNDFSLRLTFHYLPANRLSFPWLINLAGTAGLEPTFSRPERDVLPIERHASGSEAGTRTPIVRSKISRPANWPTSELEHVRLFTAFGACNHPQAENILVVTNAPKSGGRDGHRTRDLRYAKPALSQIELHAHGDTSTRKPRRQVLMVEKVGVEPTWPLAGSFTDCWT